MDDTNTCGSEGPRQWQSLFFFGWVGDDITTATPQLVDFFGGCTDSCLSVYATEKLRKKNQTVLSTRRINDSVAQTIGGAKNSMCTERSVIYRCNRWSGKVFLYVAKKHGQNVVDKYRVAD